ncbi:MAG: YgjV family protein [Eubacteriales bacterium]
MTPYEIVAQGIGIVALTMVICSFQQNDRKKLMVFQIFATTLYSVHFVMLGAMSGAAMNMLCAVRAVVFYDRSKKWVQSPVCPIIFSVLSVVLGVVTWAGPMTLLPTVATVLTSLSFWAKTPKSIRLFTLPASPMWLVYNILNRSYSGVLTECFVMTSIIVAMIRFDFPKKKKTS